MTFKAQAAIPSGGWKGIWSVARPVLVMACGLAILQQVMGYNTVLCWRSSLSQLGSVLALPYNHILLWDL